MSSAAEAVEGRGEADLPSDGGEGPPARTVETAYERYQRLASEGVKSTVVDEYCPLCRDLIGPDEDTCRIRGILWHLACYDELVWEDTR